MLFVYSPYPYNQNAAADNMPHDANSGKYPKCFITVPYTALDLPAPRYVEKIDYTADRSGVTGFAAGKRIITQHGGINNRNSHVYHAQHKH